MNRELEEEEEEEEESPVKMEVESPRMGREEKKTRIIRRRVERPKTVYERFPTFERDKVLDFTELFKGYTVPKSRISKRYFTGMLTCCGRSMPLIWSHSSRNGVSEAERAAPRLS